MTFFSRFLMSLMRFIGFALMFAFLVEQPVLFSQNFLQDPCFDYFYDVEKPSDIHYQLLSHGVDGYEIIRESQTFPNPDRVGSGSVADTHIWLNSGIIYHNMKAGQDAIEAFKRSVEMGQDSENAYYSLGYWYKISGQLDKALKVWEKGFKNYLRSKKFSIALYKTYLSEKMYAKAELYAKEAIQIDPDARSTRFDLGMIYKGMSKFQKAVQAFQEEIKVNPNDARTYEQLGCLFSGPLNDYPQAVSYYAKAVENGSQNGCTYNDLAWYSMVVGDHGPQVVQWAQKGLELDSENRHIQGTLAWAYYRNEAYEQAIVTFKNMGDNLSFIDCFGMGLTYLKLGQRLKGKRLMMRALSMPSVRMKKDEMIMIESERSGAERILGKSFMNIGHFAQ